MCNADESYAKNPKYARSRACACCGIAHEFLAFLLLGGLQVICYLTVMQNCWPSGRVRDISKFDVSSYAALCDNKLYKDSPICKKLDNYEGMIEGAKQFCDAESGVLAISVVSIIVSLILFFIAMVNACKCCVACCGGKQKKNLINVVFSAIGSIVALVVWIIYLGLNSAYTQYKTNYEEITKGAGGTTSEPLEGGFGLFFEAALIIVLVWGCFLIVQRVVQGALSFMASREEWKGVDDKLATVQVA